MDSQCLQNLTVFNTALQPYPVVFNSVSPPSFLSSAIDLMYGGIYCFLCQDYIYDKDMEIIAKEEQRKAWKMQGLVPPQFTCLILQFPHVHQGQTQ